MIRNQGDLTYTGQDEFAGATTTTQSVAQDADAAGATVIYQLLVQNFVAAPDRFLLTGPASGSGWTINYFDEYLGGLNITAQMNGLGWSTDYLPLNGTAVLRVEVTPDSTVALNRHEHGHRHRAVGHQYDPDGGCRAGHHHTRQ